MELAIYTEDKLRQIISRPILSKYQFGLYTIKLLLSDALICAL